MRTAVFAAALLAASFVAPAAFAQVESQSISMNNVDMSDTAQVARLHQAVVRTADNICRRAGAAAGADLRSCVRDAVDRAVAGNPAQALRAYHEAQPAGQRYTVAN